VKDSCAMFLRAARVLAVSAVIAAIAVPACGNTSDSTTTATGGSGGSAGHAGASGTAARAGSGGEAGIQSVSCGTNTCMQDVLNIPGEPAFTIPGCCSDESTNTCGLDSSFLGMFGPSFDVACQALAQPGTLDAACPDSVPAPIPNMPGLTLKFQGCCRANGTCGYQLDNIDGLPFLHLGLGCVDSTPFLEGGAPLSCGENGAAGAGGAGPSGSAGAPGSAGETAQGGASGG